jgi:hypothetical protein
MNLDDKNIFNELNNQNNSNSNYSNSNNSNSNYSKNKPTKNDMNNRSNNFGLGNEEVMDFELSYVDYLTSQYIDAELSFSEDAELRELIAKDEKSKTAFDSSVDIFLAIKKENATLELNNDLFSKSNLDKTEDLLMSKLFGNDVIFAETNDKNDSLKENKKENEYKPLVFENISIYAKDVESVNAELDIDTKPNTPKILQLNNENVSNVIVNNVKNYFSQINIRKFAAVAACLMIFSIYNISEFKNDLGITSFASIDMEMKYNDNDNEDVNENVKETIKLANRQSKANKSIASNKINFNKINSTNNSKSDIYLVSANGPINKNELNVSNSESTQIENNNLQSSLIAANADVINNTNEIIADNKINNPIIENSLENQIIENPINNINNSKPNLISVLDNNSSNVKLNYYEPSYLATEKPKLNAKITSSMSNEFNNSFFAEKHNAEVTHYAQSIAFGIDENTDFGFELGYSDLNFDDKTNLKITKEIPNPTPGSNLKTYTTIIVPVELRKNYSLYWAMGFMESKVVNIAGIDLLGRVGLGLSNDGLQSYLRLNSRYELITNLYINLGVDSRYMSVNLPLYVNTENIRNTSSFSINYGIQYKF